MNILLVILLFVVLICCVYAFAIWYTRFLIKIMVENKHDMLNSILQTGEVPTAWKKYSKHHHYMRKLEEMIKYVKTSNLIMDESTRSNYLIRLDEVREKWEQAVLIKKNRS